MEFAYTSLLKQWGFQPYIENFSKQGIDDESFELLDSETIQLLFALSGPRLIFKKKYTEYLNNSKHQLSANNFETASDSDTLGSNFSFDDTCMIIEPDDELRKAFKVQVLPSGTHTLSATQNFTDYRGNISDQNLEELFNKTAEGQVILANRKKLNSCLRSKIAKIIVGSLVNGSTLCQSKLEIKSSQFVKAAKEIAAFFPGESAETYYIPFSSPKHGLRRQPARGKLWSRYINLKAALRLANANRDDSSSPQESSQISIPIEADDNKINFLKIALEPYEKILLAWEETFVLRKNNYKHYELEELYNEFPCLRLYYGIELVESDFNKENEDKIDIIYKEWPNIAQAIILEGRERNLIMKDDGMKDISSKALLLLPFLFSPVTVKNSKKHGIWRPSRSEVQESFILKVKDFAEITGVLERRKQKLQSYDLPLQPFGAIVGDEDADVKAFYIFINDVTYKCDSAIRCLELLYKVFHALNLEYPGESKHVWYLIQELVFKTNVTSKVGSTACVISDINFHLSKLA